jgi:acetoin utilization deacetylase AcuC-like enzyme
MNQSGVVFNFPTQNPWIMVELQCYFHIWCILTITVGSYSTVTKFTVIYDSSNHLHRDITFHYENPERITSCVCALDGLSSNNGHVELVDIAPMEYDSSTPESLKRISNRLSVPVTEEELFHAKNILLQTHQQEVVTSLEERCRRSKEERIQSGKPPLGYIGYLDGGDTFVTTETFDVCLRAMVAWIRAVNLCCISESHPPPKAMACTRPPGHHATYNLQNGFCLYNFAAAAAIHAINNCNGVAKVSILDWDVHYGQGVADIASRYDGQIRYVSIHQSPAFPYEGEKLRRNGNVLTLPIAVETSWSCGYSDKFEQALQFCATKDEWEPDLVIVCAGYDALSNDELANVNLDAADYGLMTNRLCQHLSETCRSKVPKLMLGLEGGYRVSSGGSSGNLPDAVVETVQAILDQSYI